MGPQKVVNCPRPGTQVPSMARVWRPQFRPRRTPKTCRPGKLPRPFPLVVWWPNTPVCLGRKPRLVLPCGTIVTRCLTPMVERVRPTCPPGVRLEPLGPKLRPCPRVKPPSWRTRCTSEPPRGYPPYPLPLIVCPWVSWYPERTKGKWVRCC